MIFPSAVTQRCPVPNCGPPSETENRLGYSTRVPYRGSENTLQPPESLELPSAAFAEVPRKRMRTKPTLYIRKFSLV